MAVKIRNPISDPSGANIIALGDIEEGDYGEVVIEFTDPHGTDAVPVEIYVSPIEGDPDMPEAYRVANDGSREARIRIWPSQLGPARAKLRIRCGKQGYEINDAYEIMLNGVDSGAVRNGTGSGRANGRTRRTRRDPEPETPTPAPGTTVRDKDWGISWGGIAALLIAMTPILAFLALLATLGIDREDDPAPPPPVTPTSVVQPAMKPVIPIPINSTIEETDSAIFIRQDSSGDTSTSPAASSTPTAPQTTPPQTTPCPSGQDRVDTVNGKPLRICM